MLRAKRLLNGAQKTQGHLGRIVLVERCQVAKLKTTLNPQLYHSASTIIDMLTATRIPIDPRSCLRPLPVRPPTTSRSTLPKFAQRCLYHEGLQLFCRHRAEDTVLDMTL